MPFVLDREDFFLPKQGKNIFRILPPYQEGNLFYKEVLTHYDVTPECRALICRKMVARTCPVDIHMASLMSSRSKQDHERAYRMRSIQRFMINVLPDRTLIPKVWSVSERMLRDILGFIVDEGMGEVLNEKEGSDVILYRKGEGVQTVYHFEVSGNTPGPLRVRPGWRSQLVDLEKAFVPPTELEVKKILGVK